MKQYDLLIKNILANGKTVKGRNGNTLELFGQQIKCDQFILTKRQMFYKGVVGELAAFLQGPTSVQDFTSQGCNYWNQWADDDGKINVDYGNAWLDFNGVNQLSRVVDQIKQAPYSRRHLVVGWKPENIERLSLPCCHYAYQWNVSGDSLNMLLVQRSADVAIGLPSDIIMMALFNMLMAQTVGLSPGELTLQLGSAHVYEEHIPGLETYLSRTEVKELPAWDLDPRATIFNFTPDQFTLTNYRHHPKIDFLLKV